MSQEDSLSGKMFLKRPFIIDTGEGLTLQCSLFQVSQEKALIRYISLSRRIQGLVLFSRRQSFGPFTWETASSQYDSFSGKMHW